MAGLCLVSCTEAIYAQGRRAFLIFLLSMGSAATLSGSPDAASFPSQNGGLGVLMAKRGRKRSSRVLPPESVSQEYLGRRCTACQSCVDACPSHVMRPSADLSHFLKPASGFERGYCRSECTECPRTYPTGGIRPITGSQKASIRTGVAVVVPSLCLTLREGAECGSCARHCPSLAILMAPSQPSDPHSPQVPSVTVSEYTGCCGYLCPSNLLSAIYVEGYQHHRPSCDCDPSWNALRIPSKASPEGSSWSF